jgi:hypothetical protein
LTPKGFGVSAFTFSMATSISSGRIVAPARKPKPPALETAATSSGVATQPMPVCTIGAGTPSRSHSTVWRGERDRG